MSSVLNAIPATAGAVNSTYIANGAVGTAQLTDANVTQAKLAANVAGNGPAFSAYQSSTTQNITQNVWTKVQYNQELFDTNNNFDKDTNYRFQPTVAGYYQVNGCVAIGTAGGMYMGVVKNGTIYQYGTNTAAATIYQGFINTVMYLNGSTDYIEIYVAPISASITVIADGTKTWFNAFLARAA